MDVLDSMVDEEDLTSSTEFPQDCLSDNFVIVTNDKGTDGETIFRRSLDEAEVSDARDGHLESPWNGSGGEGDHIH
jgi:hypothetical protein